MVEMAACLLAQSQQDPDGMTTARITRLEVTSLMNFNRLGLVLLTLDPLALAGLGLMAYWLF